MSGSKQSIGSDPTISLRDLRDKVNDWINEYGDNAVLTIDAGYNNVELIIDTRKKTIKGYKKTGI